LQALTALRAHASQRGHTAQADDPERLLPDNDSHHSKRDPVTIGNPNSSPIRPRVRRHEEEESHFGSSLVVQSSGVALNSGLGAALMSVFNDIVSDTSNQEICHPSDFGGSNSEDRDEKLDFDASCEDVSPRQAHEEVAQLMNADVEFDLVASSDPLFQNAIICQNDVCSAEASSSEHSVTSVKPDRSKQPSPLREVSTSLDLMSVVAPPTHGSATPRRAKEIQAATGALSTSRDQNAQPVEQEMDM
jgi:hypothetical protein